MKLRQQVIQDRVESLAGELGITSDDAFLRLVCSLVTGGSVHALDPNDIVDGGEDKQIDVISIQEGADSADVYVIQTKFKTSFPSNALIQLANGLKWLLQRSRREVSTLSNVALRDKILEYREVQNNLGPARIRVHVGFATNGSTAKLSREFEQERRAVLADYDTNTFESFFLQILGCDELTELSKSQERQTRRVDADIRIPYDTNKPSLMIYHSKGLKGLICSLPAEEIARLVNDNPDGALFDMNIRRFLGTRGAVNRDIQSTCTQAKESHQFWFLNNGVTIVCDQFDPVTDPDNPHVKVRNLQIVNGCQTATTLALAQREGTLAAGVRVLARIYETTDADLVSKIVLTTNNQNRITSRDLRANDPLQVDMESAFSIYDYYYERKPRQFDGKGVDLSRLVTNEDVGQAYLAIVLRNPSDARARKYKVWGELHSRVFAGGAIEPYVVAVVLARRVSEWLRRSGHVTASEEDERLLAKRGALHIARIAAFLWRGSDDWETDSEALRHQLEELESSPDEVEKLFPRAFSLLRKEIRSSKADFEDVDGALKSAVLDRNIDRLLHRRRARRV